MEDVDLKCSYDNQPIITDKDFDKHFACMPDEEKCKQFIHWFLCEGMMRDDFNLANRGDPKTYLSTVSEVVLYFELECSSNDLKNIAIILHNLSCRTKLDLPIDTFVKCLIGNLGSLQGIGHIVNVGDNVGINIFSFIKYFVYMLFRNFVTKEQCVCLMSVHNGYG